MTETLEAFEIAYPTSEEASKTDKKFAPVLEGVYWVSTDDVRGSVHARGPMFGLKFKIDEDTMHNGKHDRRLVWSNIIFLPYFSDAAKTNVTPGAGIARSFLKAIGEEYKGDKLRISPANWKGKKLGIRVKLKDGKENVSGFFTQEEYTKLLATPVATTELKESDIF